MACSLAATGKWHACTLPVLVDGEVVATLEAMTRQYMLPRIGATPPFRLAVQALADNDAVIGTTIRQVAARFEDDTLSATVYGPTLVELVFNRQEPWTSRTMRYQVWRNCEFLTLAQENADGYWDSTAQPGRSYTYYLTPLYSRFNDVNTQAALRDYPPLQRRSNSVTVVTHAASGGVEATPLACLNGPLDDGGGNGNYDGSVDAGNDGNDDDTGADTAASDSVTVNGLVIAWTAAGWHQVQSLDDYRSWCEGGFQCEVQPGTYVVINHTTGERIEPVIVTGDSTDDSPDSTSGPVVDGNAIHWPDDGWYQVQDATTYQSLCEGGLSCEVPAGTYIIINHHTGQRWTDIQVTGDLANTGVFVDKQTIHLPDDGWYQVQNAVTYESLCEGVRTCVVPDGRYIVINHTTGTRNENVLVDAGDSGDSGGNPGDNEEPGIPTGVDALAPSNLRLDIYGPAIAELFWNNAAGVVNTEIYRDGTLLGMSPGRSYFDGTRQAGNPHRYALVAVDGSGQRSATIDYGHFENISVEIPGYYGGHNEETIAMSGNIAVMSAYTGAGARTIQVFERSDAGQQDWRLTHTFPMDKEFLWDSAIALHADTIVFASLRYDEERSYYENELDYADYSEYDFLFMTRSDSGDWTMQTVTDFSDALQPNLPSQYVSVAVEGDTAMLGGRNGAVYVFSRGGDGQWTETQKLASPNAHHFGYSLSLDSDTAAIGRVASYFDQNPNEPPAAVVFTRDSAGLWSEQQVLQSDAENDEDRIDVVVHGDTLVMTGNTLFDTGDYSTQHHIYRRTNGQWTLSQQIAIDSYGTSIALDDDRLVIGAPGEDGGSTYTGTVHVFEQAASGDWLETGELFAGTTIHGFGSDTALSADTVFAIGGQDDSSRGFFYALP